MSAISSHSLPSYVPNRYKANAGADCVPKTIVIREYGDKEWSNGSGLEMYETFYRSYNAQLGRFMQADPKMEATITMSGYLFSVNNPAMYNDPAGDRAMMPQDDSRGQLTIWNRLRTTPSWVSDSWDEYFGEYYTNLESRFEGGNGGGGSGVTQIQGGVSFSGQTAKEVFKSIVDAINGNGRVWIPGFGYYDGSLYPEDAKWVALSEVVVNGRNKGYSSQENANRFFQDPYSIRNGKNIPLSSFDKGTERFSHGYSSQTTLILNDGQLKSYLNDKRKYFDKANNPLYGIAIGLAFARSNPWIGTTLGKWTGLQSISMSEMSSKFNQVLIDYLGQNHKNGMYLIIRDVSYTPGWGAAASSHSTSIQFYFPQGVLFKEINYSFH